MKKIEDYNKRMVTFCKRRKGLFKKASEIEAKTAVVVFGENGKVYRAGDVDSIFDEFMSGKSEKKEGFWWEKKAEDVMLESLIEYESAILELKDKVDAEIGARSGKEPQPCCCGGASSSAAGFGDRLLVCDDFGVGDFEVDDDGFYFTT